MSMAFSGASVVIMAVGFALAFGAARLVGRWLRARRGARAAEQAREALAQQSRQVRRAAARRQKH